MMHNPTEMLSDIAAEIFPNKEETAAQVEPVVDKDVVELERVDEPPAIELEEEVEQSVGDDQGEVESGYETLNELLAEVVEHDDLPGVYGLPIKLDTGETVILGEVKDALQEKDRKIVEQEEALQAATAASQNQHVGIVPPDEAINAIATIRSLADQWNYLEANKGDMDAGELALARQDLESKYKSAVYARDTAISNHQKALGDQRIKFVNDQVGMLMKKRPELNTQAAMNTAIESVKTIGKQYGFQDQEIMQVADHRHIQILLDLAAYKAKEKGGKELLKNGKRGNVVRLKAGARRNKADPKKKTHDLEKRAKANPRDKSALGAALNAIAEEGGIKLR